MKIFGIGTDIVNIKRIDLALKKNGKKFKNRIFSKKEIKYCEDKKYPSSYFAKRFAAKEAFSKALGTGIRKGVKVKLHFELNFNSVMMIVNKLQKLSLLFLLSLTSFQRNEENCI